MPPDGLTWLDGRLGDIQGFMKDRFDRLDGRLDGFEERLRAVEQNNAAAASRRKTVGAILDWARYLMAGIVGALAGHLIGGKG